MTATSMSPAATVLERAPDLLESYTRYRAQLEQLIRDRHLAPSDLAGKRVLDWECGAGVFALVLLERGAASVTAIDSWLLADECAKNFAGVQRLNFLKSSLEEFASDPSTHGTLDVILANTTTEHMLNLPRQFPLCRRLLRPGGLLITNHDNYYQPVGSHDHGFLFYGPGNSIVRQGPACWDSTSKCAVSLAHRREVMRSRPWTWDERMEQRLTPHDCTKCPYFKRSQPWAHLRYQAEFRDLFPQPEFTTGHPKSSLNKVTLFQLRQFIIEGGFDIRAWVPHRVGNKPPRDLLSPPLGFSPEDLTTTTVAVIATRSESSPYDG
jgi:SAM-dependent methyltransferase